MLSLIVAFLSSSFVLGALVLLFCCFPVPLFLLRNTRVHSRKFVDSINASTITDAPTELNEQDILTNLHPIRPLGLLERWYAASHDNYLLLNVIFSIPLKVLSPSPPSPTSLHRDVVAAVWRVCTQHPSLQVTIEERNGKPHFVPVQAFAKNLPSFVEVIELENTHNAAGLPMWQVVAEREHHRPFTIDSWHPLWRIVVLISPVVAGERARKMDIIVVFHHVIGDGLSVATFCREFLHAHAYNVYHNTIRQRDSSIAPLPYSPGLSFQFDGYDVNSSSAFASPFPASSDHPVQCVDAPPLDNVVDMRPPLGRIIKALLQSKLPFLNFSSTGWLGPKHVPPPTTPEEKKAFERTLSQVTDDVKTFDCPRGAGFVAFSLSKEETQALVNRAKSENTTVHAALVLGLSEALYQVTTTDIDTSLATKSLLLSTSSAVSLRPFANPPLPVDCFGAYVCGAAVAESFPLAPGGFWDAARAFKKQLQNSVEYGIQTLGLLEFVDDWRALMDKLKLQEPNGRTESIAVSNLGVVPLQQLYGDWSVQHVWFSHVKFGEGPLINVSAVTVLDQLHLTLAFPIPVLSRKTVEKMESHFRRCLSL